MSTPINRGSHALRPRRRWPGRQRRPWRYARTLTRAGLVLCGLVVAMAALWPLLITVP